LRSYRGFKIPAIENMGVLQDSYDTIDLSDNEIRSVSPLARPIAASAHAI
jgi:hypothetical protein